MFVEPNATPWWSYILDHLSIAFWLAALGIVWRFRKAVDTWVSNFGTVQEKTIAVERMVMETHGMTTQIRDNHLTHIAEDLKKQEEKLDKHLEVLQSIDRNIAVMAAIAERNGHRRKEH